MIDPALYYFTPSALNIELNTPTGEGGFKTSETCTVSVVAGAAIKVANELKTQANQTLTLGYNAQLGYRQFTFTGYNTVFGYELEGTTRHYNYDQVPICVYIRLDASNNGSTGELVFLPYEVDYDGRLLLAPGTTPAIYPDIAIEERTDTQGNTYYTLLNDNEENDSHLSFYYIHIGTIAAPDNNTRAWLNVVQSGQLETAKGNNEDNTGTWSKMFRLSPNNIIQVLLPFDRLSFQASGDAFVNRIITTVSATIDGFSNWAQDHGFATTASTASYISAMLKTLEDKYFRKDQPDTSPHLATFGDMHVKAGMVIPPATEGGAPSSSAGNLEVDNDLSVGGNADITGFLEVENVSVLKGSVTMKSDNRSVGSMEFGENGDYIQGLQGCKIFHNGSGWEVETEYLTVNKRMYAKSIQVDEVTHVGGENLLTDASCIADQVKEYTNFYRVFFRKKNGEGRTIYNQFRVGDQAYCQIFNIDPGLTSEFTNRYYWRLVINTSNGSGTYGAETTELMENFHFIDLSKTDCDGASTMKLARNTDASAVPKPEDPIVQFGYRRQQGDDDEMVEERQGATLISGGGKYKRAIIMWEGIGSGRGASTQQEPQKYYTIPSPRVVLSPQQVKLIVDSFYIRSGGDEKDINDYLGIYLIECSTSLVSSSSIENAQPTVLGNPMSSTLYAIQLGEYLLKMGEEAEGATAVITCNPILQGSETKKYVTEGTLTAYNALGSEIVSTIDTSTDTGELSFTYSQIDPTCDRVLIIWTMDGAEKARASIGIVKDGKDGRDGTDGQDGADGQDGQDGTNAQFYELEDKGTVARIAFTDSEDAQGQPVTTMQLNLAVNALVNFVDGNTRTNITPLTAFKLRLEIGYRGVTQTTTIVGTREMSAFVYTPPQPLTIEPEYINTVSKYVTMVLLQNDIEKTRLEVPITLDEASVYVRTNASMQSIFAQGKNISTLSQTAARISALVAELGDGLSATGIDIIHHLIKLTADQLRCYNNSGVPTAWLDHEGNWTTAGVQNNLITKIDSGGSSKYVAWQDEWTDEYHCAIDILRCGNVIKMTSLPDFSAFFPDEPDKDWEKVGNMKILRLPYFISDEKSFRTRTGNPRYEEDVEHFITGEEMKMMVGKKIDIVVDLPTNTADFVLSGIYRYTPKAISSASTTSTLEQAVISLANGTSIVDDSTGLIKGDITLFPRMTIHLECKIVRMVTGIQCDTPDEQVVNNHYAYVWTADYSTAAADEPEAIDILWAEQEEQEEQE